MGDYQGCGYQGYEFGARYLDSLCQGGWLQDMDSDFDSREWDYRPCPQCRQLETMDHYAEDFLMDADCKWPRYYAWHLVMDIRRNRGLRSVPFAAFMAHRAWRLVGITWAEWRERQKTTNQGDRK